MPSSSSSSSSDEQYDEFENEIVQASFQYLITHYNQSQIPKKFRQPRRFIERDHEEGYHRLYNDYFSLNPTYTPELFCRRFPMRRPLFHRLVNAVEEYNTYFQPTPDNKGKLGISALQKCTAAIRILAYGESFDRNDEYLRLSETVARDSLVAFTNVVVAVFGDEYMRTPTVSDLITKAFANWGKTGISRNVGEYRLYALAMEKLPCRLEMPVPMTKWENDSTSRSCCNRAPLDVTLLLWHTEFV